MRSTARDGQKQLTRLPITADDHYFEERLDRWMRNKSIQNICQSLRVDADEKRQLRTLHRHE